MASASRSKLVCASLATVLPFLATAASDWSYTLGQARDEQQANFCDARADIEEIAGIFTRYGPRAGYSALSGSPNCAVSVKTFTPREVLITVVISEGEPGEYRIRFIEIESDGGEVEYLVTTRDVVAR